MTCTTHMSWSSTNYSAFIPHCGRTANSSLLEIGRGCLSSRDTRSTSLALTWRRRTWHSFSEPCGVKELSHTPYHSSGALAGPHIGTGTGGKDKLASTKASSTLLTDRTSLTTIEVSSNQVDLLLVHCITDSKQQVLRDSAFFGICVVDVDRNHGKTRLAIFAVSSGTKHKKWRLVVPILTVLLSQHVAVHLQYRGET